MRVTKAHQIERQSTDIPAVSCDVSNTMQSAALVAIGMVLRGPLLCTPTEKLVFLGWFDREISGNRPKALLDTFQSTSEEIQMSAQTYYNCPAKIPAQTYMFAKNNNCASSQTCLHKTYDCAAKHNSETLKSSSG